MNRFVLIAIVLSSLWLSGCAGYHCGSIAHPDMQTAEILPVNLTEEPMVAQQLRMKFQQRLFQDSGLRLAPRGVADVVVKAKVISISQIASGSTRVALDNDPRADRYNSDYRTSLYQATLTLEYEVWKRSKSDAPFLPAHKVTATADFPRLPDMQTAKQAAIENAIDSAVASMLAEISEAW